MMKLTLFKRTGIKKTISPTKRTVFNTYNERNIKELVNVEFATFEFIIETLFDEIARVCIETQTGVKLPYGNGVIAIGKFKPTLNSNSYKRMQHTAYTRNLYDPYLCKWLWLKTPNHYYGYKVPPRFCDLKVRKCYRKMLSDRLLTDISSEMFFNIDKRLD